MLELCQPRHCFFKSVPKRLDVGFQNVNQWIRAAVEVVEKRSKPPSTVVHAGLPKSSARRLRVAHHRIREEAACICRFATLSRSCAEAARVGVSPRLRPIDELNLSANEFCPGKILRNHEECVVDSIGSRAIVTALPIHCEKAAPNDIENPTLQLVGSTSKRLAKSPSGLLGFGSPTGLCLLQFQLSFDSLNPKLTPNGDRSCADGDDGRDQARNKCLVHVACLISLAGQVFASDRRLRQ